VKTLIIYGVAAIAVFALVSTIDFVPFALLAVGGLAAYYALKSATRKAGGLMPWMVMVLGPKLGKRLFLWCRYVAQAGLRLADKTWARVVGALALLWLAGSNTNYDVADDYRQEILDIKQQDGRSKRLCELANEACGGLLNPSPEEDTSSEDTSGEDPEGEDAPAEDPASGKLAGALTP